MGAAEKQQPSTTILLKPDGTHETLVRQMVMIDEAKRLAAEQGAKGKTGWIAELVGGYFDQQLPSLFIRTKVGRPGGAMAKAVQAFWTRRAAVMK